MTSRNWTIYIAVLIGLFVGGLVLRQSKASGPGTGDRSALQKPLPPGAQRAVFAAGCFWGVEAEFRQIKGVLRTEVGYSGGKTKAPTYEEVCTDMTGHAESVQVWYDPKKVSYDKLLTVFWANHDPTTLNRQGPDSGTQYRSAIFYATPEQEKLARASVARLQKTGKYQGAPSAIVTQIMPAQPFYRAEEYHQQYLEKRGLSSCHL